MERTHTYMYIYIYVGLHHSIYTILYPADVSAQYPLKKPVHNSEKSLVGLNERKTKGCNILDEPLPVSEKSSYMFLKRFVEFQKSTRGLHHTPSCRRERPLPSEKNPDMCLKGARTYFWKGSWNWKRARQRNVPHRILQTSAPNKLWKNPYVSQKEPLHVSKKVRGIGRQHDREMRHIQSCRRERPISSEKSPYILLKRALTYC